MQQFFLFCTMLIITFEAFSENLHGSQFSPSIRRKSSAFARRHKYLIPNMFNDLNFPVSLVTSASENPDYESLFFIPLYRRGFAPKCDKNYFSRKKWRFKSRKKLLNEKQRNQISSSDVPDSPQSFKNFWLLGPELWYEPHKNGPGSFGNIFNFKRDLIENPNQYIVCFYPVLNRFKKKTFCFLKKPKFSDLKRQYLNNLRNKILKNKRSTNSLSGANEIIYEQKLKVTESKNRHKNIDVNMTDFESPNNFILNTPYPIDEDPSVQSNNKNSGSKNHNENFDTNSSFINNSISVEEKDKNSISINNQGNGDTKNPISESPEKVIFGSNSNLGSSEENSLLSPLSNIYTDLYSSYLDVTQAPAALPKIAFKYPYNPNVYEPSLRRESHFFWKPVKKEAFNAEEKSEANVDGAFSQNIEKLKQMLEEVESVLQCQINDKKNKKEKRSKKKEKKKNKKNEKTGVSESLNNSTSIKEKIDNLAIPILKNISDELGKMSNGSSLSSTSSTPSSTPKPFIFSSSGPGKSKSVSQKTNEYCSPNGTWTSTVLGLEMAITMMPNMMLKVGISSAGVGIINKNWSIHGLTLAKQGGPLMLAAVYPQGKKIASFLGQCKMCKDQELIFGTWTIYSCVRKYTDLWSAVETKLDILRNLEGKFYSKSVLHNLIDDMCQNLGRMKPKLLLLYL